MNSLASEVTGVVCVTYNSAKYSGIFSLRCSQNKFLTKIFVLTYFANKAEVL